MISQIIKHSCGCNEKYKQGDGMMGYLCVCMCLYAMRVSGDKGHHLGLGFPGTFP